MVAAAVGTGMTGNSRRAVPMSLGTPPGVCANVYSGRRTSTHTKGFRVMMAAGHPWGRGSLAEAAKLWQNRRILMLTRASNVTVAVIWEIPV